MKKILIIAYLLSLNTIALAYNTDTLTIHENKSALLNNHYFYELEDPRADLSINQVLKSTGFHPGSTSLPVLKYSKSATWIKFNLKNNDNKPFTIISIDPSVIDEFDLYYLDSKHIQIHHFAAEDQQDEFESRNITYIKCPIKPGTSNTIYLRIKSNSPAMIPVKVYSEVAFIKSRNIENIVYGAFMGILLISAFYNLLLLFIVGDISYLYYVFYIIFLGAAQTLLRGYGNYFAVNKIFINSYIIPLVRMCFGLSVLLFTGEFLQLKQTINKEYKIYLLLYALFAVIFVAILGNFVAFAYNLINWSIVITAIYLLYIGSQLYLKGFKPAKLFMLAWSLFLIGILFSFARNKDLIPYNIFTANIVPFSLVIELILFSAALADKINFYRNEKIGIQNFAIAVARENERLITEQNILLENKVKERTDELINANRDLSTTINDLKSTQHRLIDTEKMASLGRLTAGVAHEINNPINFVSSNVNPLRINFDELFLLLNKYEEVLNNPDDAKFVQTAHTYRQSIDPDFIKEEIAILLNGIEEGARRTTEIVKSLFTFSSTDGQELKMLDINKAILANILILKSTTPYYIEIKTVFDNIEPLKCYPGKINQVLINLIANSIYAIKAKDQPSDDTITIVTRDVTGYIFIEITDTGMGMTNDTKERIFEPFFTTKNVGEGTGLGLSIVFGIIEKHHGSIDVISSPGKGTTFTIRLPQNLT
jgi:two-component system NtrC family sensor kinase